MLKVDLPDYEFHRAMERQEVSPSEMRAHLRKVGMLPPARYQERAPYVSCSGGVFEEFVPPEGDGKASVLSAEVSKAMEKCSASHKERFGFFFFFYVTGCEAERVRGGEEGQVLPGHQEDPAVRGQFRSEVGGKI